MAKAYFLIAFLTFLAVAKMAESLCCDEIKSEFKKKTKVFKLLCSVKRLQVFANCCKGLDEEIKKYRMAYMEICNNCSEPKPLGMESGSIPDSSLTASSVYSSGYAPKSARLNKKPGPCCWLAAGNAEDAKQSWLQVDFGIKTAVVTGVATQGSCNEVEWVNSYVIWYSVDEVNWKYINEGGAPKEFQGNTDQNTVVTNKFKEPIVARYVRITPRTYNNWAEMRVEYYGCSMVEK